MNAITPPAEVTNLEASAAGATSDGEPPVAQQTLTLEQTVQDLHAAGRSQRAIARDLEIGRRKVKQIIDREAA